MLTLRHARAREDWNDKNLAEKGFTLVELLVVIIILGILAAVVVIAVQSFQDRGKLNACKTEKRTIEAAAAAYFTANNDTWPATDANLTTPPVTTPPQTPYIKRPKYVWTNSATDPGTYTAGVRAATATTPASGPVPDGCNT